MTKCDPGRCTATPHRGITFRTGCRGSLTAGNSGQSVDILEKDKTRSNRLQDLQSQAFNRLQHLRKWSLKIYIRYKLLHGCLL